MAEVLPRRGSAREPGRPAVSASADGSRRRLERPDRIALAVLILLPLVVQLPFSLSGHPLLQGDNLTQNYPLRVLAGQLLHSGRLPSWDAFIWSGTPLLAGWNAGAMFPATFLFAFLPHLGAWAIDQLFTPIVAAVGAYLLLRRLRCGPLPAFIGGFAFAWTGFLSGQVVHIGLTQGTSLLPWSLLALNSIERGAVARARLSEMALPIAGLAASVALTVLAGDPRAVSTAAIVLIAVMVATCLRLGRRSGRFLLVALGGALVGICCSAAQWLPGIGFLRSSQRGSAAYSFFAAGSFSFSHLIGFLLLPFADGGTGNLGMPVYSGAYNLPELTIGVGIVAAVAFCAFLPEVFESARARLLRARRGGPSSDTPGREGFEARRPLGLWYVLALLGAVLALGASTPLGHLLVHVPLFGGERLQNRNAEILDLALVVLLAFFCEDLLGPGAAERRSKGIGALATPVSRWLALAPLALTAAGIAYVGLDPKGAQSHYGNAVVNLGLPGRLVVYFIWELLVVAGTAVVVLGRFRSARPVRLLLLAALALDLGLFPLNANYATASAQVAAGPTAASKLVQHLAGSEGRFAIFNPTFANPSPDPDALNRLGVTDLNIVQGSPSVEGYGSIVDSTYDAATFTHTYENLNPARLAGETFDTLDLTALITTTQYLYQELRPHSAIPLADGTARSTSGATVAASSAPPRMSPASGSFLVAPGSTLSLQIGAPTGLQRIDVVLARDSGALSGPLRAATITGATLSGWHPLTISADQARGNLPADHASAVEIENLGPAAVTVDAVVVVTRHPNKRLLLDGELQGDLPAPHWHWLRAIGPFLSYRNTQTRGLAWLQPVSHHVPDVAARAPGSVRLTGIRGNGADVLGGPVHMVVDAPKGGLLVRSETYEPGWTAKATPLAGGPSHTYTVHRFGLVQVIGLPAGRFRVTWRYAPANLVSGLALSVVGLVLLVALLLLGWARQKLPLGRRPARTPDDGEGDRPSGNGGRGATFSPRRLATGLSSGHRHSSFRRIGEAPR
ncbi:MAG: hypothetical protein JWM85_2703 [Acidimicrobiaceae bacterium]|nr:hypothetical protein [Acidimicrobiaceae bacterium]